MASPSVVNASPLIFLARAGLLDLLRLSSDSLLVPEAVATEIRRRGPADVTAQAIETAPWLSVIETPPVPARILAWDLGPGESAVLGWAYLHPGTEAIVDDLAGRRCASALSLPVRGTLGLVLAAKQRGVIPAARPVLERLRLSGMYLSERVMNRALMLVGE